MITTDLGSEFDVQTLHYQPDGFHQTIEQKYHAKHRFNPPPCLNAIAEVECVHATIETELFESKSSTPDPTSLSDYRPTNSGTTRHAKTAPVVTKAPPTY